MARKYKKKTPKRKIKDKLDREWSKAVKERVGWVCEKCGNDTGLNSHHIFGRRNLSVRWDLENGVSLCVACHKYGKGSAHENPMEFSDWIREVRGEEWYDLLRLKANSIAKWSMDELELMLFNLTGIE